MTKYIFPNFNVELVYPIIEDLQASYMVDSDSVRVTATLNANGNKLYSVFLGYMENTPSWTDSDVMSFATKQLETFKI